MQADSTTQNVLKIEKYTPQEIFNYLRTLLETTLFTIKDTPVTLLTIFIFLLIIIGFSLFASFIKRTLHKKILPGFIKDNGLRYTLARMSQYVIVIFGFYFSFQFLGIDLTGLAVIFGFLSVGIGFGLQSITSNFIAGLIVLFERPISVGDRIIINGIECDVQEINIRSTTVLSINNISIIVPNSDFVSKEVVNYSYGDPTFRLDIDVGISRNSDLEIVFKALNEVAEAHEQVLKFPKHDVHLRSFGESAWNIKLLVWMADVKNQYIVLNELNQAIVHKFREYNIEMPFPQRDLRFRSTMSIERIETKETE